VHARFAFLGAVLLVAAVAACGGGGGSTPPTPVSTPTPSGTATPTPNPSPANFTLGASGSTTALPVIVGSYVSGTLTLPTGSGSGTMTAGTVAPGNTPTLDISKRHTLVSVRAAATPPAPFTALAYYTITSNALSMNGLPGFSLTFASAPTATYYLSVYESNGFWYPAGQFSASGNTISIASTSSPVYTVNGTQPLYFAIYASTTGAIPNPNPDGCVGVQPDATTRTGAHAALVGVQPITPGATFSYAGTLLSTIARATPCAMPTATSSASVSVTVTMTTAPGAPGGTADEHSVENDMYSTNTTTVTTDAIVEATTAPAPQSFAELSETSSDAIPNQPGNQPGDTTVTTYATPLVYAIASPLPFHSPIVNGPPSTVNATLSDGTTTSRTYTPDGAYTESDTVPGGGSNSITAFSTFAGNYTIDSGQGELEFVFSAPSGGVINLTERLGNDTLGTLAIPQWWTGNSLYSDTTTDTGENGLPSVCQPSPTVASADDFHRVISIVDPALGYTETETIDSYVVKNYVSTTTVGPACVTIDDVQKLYYDYFYDTTYAFYGALGGPSAPLQTDTLSEAYWYTGAPTGDNTVRTLSANPGGVSGLSASIAAHASGIAFARATQRAKRIENIARAAAAGHLGGLK
jgi:hypothetical protein